jgi:uncharacterized membrane protein YiaA
MERSMTKNRITFSILLILGGAAVFVLGSPYYTVFPTNWNQAYYVALTIFFLISSAVLKRSQSLSRFWPLTYSLFIASAALVFLKTGILNLPNDSSNLLQFMVIDKLSQFLHVVPVIRSSFC